MEAYMNTLTSLLLRSVRTTATLSILAGAAALTGCMMDPPGPSPIFSRLPADQTSTAQPLTPEQRHRYDTIDQQVLAEQNQAMAAEAAAQAWSRYYAAPVSVFGSYYSGWGHGWSTGIGYGWGW
jgi:hypothetical protein